MSLLNQVLRDLATRRGRERDSLSGVALPGGGRPERSGWRRPAAFGAMVVVLTGALIGARLIWLDGTAGRPPPEPGANGAAAAGVGSQSERAVSEDAGPEADPSAASPERAGRAAAESGAEGASADSASRLTGVRRGGNDDRPWWELRFDGAFGYELISSDRRWGVALSGVDDDELPEVEGDGSRVRASEWRSRESGPMLVLETAPGVRIEASRPEGSDGRLRLAAVGGTADRGSATESTSREDGTSEPSAAPDPGASGSSAGGQEETGAGQPIAAEGAAAKTPDSSPASGPTPATPAEDAGGGRMEMRASEPSDAERAEQRYRDARRALERGHRATAEADLVDALQLDPEHHEAREMLVAMLLRDGRVAEAAERLAAGRERAPDRAAYRRLAARVALQREGPRAALVELERDPPAVRDDPAYHALMAALYQRVDQHRQALRTYRRLLDVRPRHGPWWAASGISLERLGRDDNALEAYRRSQRVGGMTAELREYVEGRVAALDGAPGEEEER